MKKGRIILITVILMFGLMGCKKRYDVDYCGEKDYYIDAKDSYPAGETVSLVYNLIDTDTNYYFYVDDEEIDFEYSEQKGYIIKFTMPNHDIKIRCETINSMEYEPDIME